MTSSTGATPGSTAELPAANATEASNRSLPVKRRRISAPAALKLLCPEEYSGKGGVGNVVGWYGNHAPPSNIRVPWYGPAHAVIGCPSNRYLIAVTGRTDANSHLLSHARIP